MRYNYSLLLKTPVLLGAEPIMDLTHLAIGWRRSILMQGGCWLGSFKLVPEDGGLALMDLKNIFYEMAGSHIEESTSGLVSWSGMLYEMDLTLGGHVKRRSLETTRNRIKAAYTVKNGDAAETSWYEDLDSQAIYGKIEEILALDGYSATQAATRAQSDLSKLAFPYPVGAGFGLEDENFLEVRVLGYAKTCSHKYTTALADADVNASVWISDIVNTDCELVSAGRIETNTLQVWKDNNIDTRAWDNVTGIVDLGDANFDLWRAYVDEDRALNYEKVDTNFAYQAEYAGGGWHISGVSGEEINPWLIRPGVVRDMSYPLTIGETGSPFLPDMRDELITEVEVGSDGTIYLKTSDSEELDILIAQQEHEKEFEDERRKYYRRKNKKKKGKK